MDNFFPFIHKIEKKKQWEPEPMYVEIYPPPPPPKKEEIEPETEIIIQL